MLTWVGLSSIGVALVLVGAIVDPSIRPVVWLVARGRGNHRGRDRRAEHDLGPQPGPPRPSATACSSSSPIGESTIVAGTAVAGDERTADLAAAAAAGHRRRLPVVVDVLRLAQGRPRARTTRPRPRSATVPSPAMPSASPTSRSSAASSDSRSRSLLPPPIPRTGHRAAVLASLGIRVALFVASSALRSGRAAAGCSAPASRSSR